MLKLPPALVGINVVEVVFVSQGAHVTSLSGNSNVPFMGTTGRSNMI
jgi:hypothetical protein